MRGKGTYEAALVEPIFTCETHDHTLRFFHRVIPLPALTATELALEVFSVCVLGVGWLDGGEERAF